MAATKIVGELHRYGLRFVLFIAVFTASPVFAQPQEPANRPFDILDNSFLVEEAFNQEPGIFQNIFGASINDGADWDFGFTQEWPLASQRHQLSYTVPVARVVGNSGIGDVFINYRYQLSVEGPGRPAVSPRVSVIIPTGNETDGIGEGVVGLQVNLPFSKQHGNFYYHWGGGFTWLPGVKTDNDEVDLLTPQLAASTIWRTGPMFNLMLESLLAFVDDVDSAGGTTRTTAFTISPGFRTGWNLGDQQIIVGAAVPVTFSEDTHDAAAFLYFSYELPFR
jgi:hypothetical protein